MKIRLGDFVQLNRDWDLRAGIVVGNSRTRRGICCRGCLDISTKRGACIVPIKDVVLIIQRGAIDKKWCKYL